MAVGIPEKGAHIDLGQTEGIFLMPVSLKMSTSRR